MINNLKDDHSARLPREALDVHRRDLDHEPRPDEDRPVKGALRESAGAWPTDGYRYTDTDDDRRGRFSPCLLELPLLLVTSHLPLGS